MGQPGWAELLLKASGVSGGGKVPPSASWPHTPDLTSAPMCMGWRWLTTERASESPSRLELGKFQPPGQEGLPA